MRRVICDVMLIVTTIKVTPEWDSAETESCPLPIAASDEQCNFVDLLVDLPWADQTHLNGELIYSHHGQVITVFTLSLHHQPPQPTTIAGDDNEAKEW